jgi:hypothetical protein
MWYFIYIDRFSTLESFLHSRISKKLIWYCILVRVCPDTNFICYSYNQSLYMVEWELIQ